ncbi:Alpha/Beta hydrolase protein [Xylariomycetidae sp. FL2044]|nr:Alpha/Beta hydrolase protein [Xylariomycetidae sp. FL2044]
MRKSARYWLNAAAVLATSAAAAGISASADAAPTVDLGYATYQGVYNETYGLNVWKSIRYAAPPIGALRWQAPQDPPPSSSQEEIISAVDQPPLCPQSGAFGVPEAYGFNSALGDEDCLYLNIFAAPQASDLPVLVWIHGGGHSVFGATYDPSIWMNANNNGFITVEIQYRLGAFGYLASADVKARGQLNAGLLDQQFALRWVQRHIAKFGGDPSRVTLGGESSGAGAVMFHAMAYGGSELDLFNNLIIASPYVPPIHGYDDSVPVAHYDKFAELAGCGRNSTRSRRFASVFDCLVAADSTTLQNASGVVSTTQGYFGSFAFLPVVDGDFIRELPATQLLHSQVGGKRLLVGTNANEGVPLTDPNVTSRAGFDDFISTTFPSLSKQDISVLNAIYHVNRSQEVDDDDGIRFDTMGDSGPTALTKSGLATAIQQSVFNIAAEATFDCPAQWLAEAYSAGSRKAWKYQYSVTPSYHGADLAAYFAEGAEVPNEDFRHAMQKVLGSFIIADAPLLSIEDATAGYANATVPLGINGTVNWPEFDRSDPWQMVLNTTGGSVSEVEVPPFLKYSVRTGPGIVNSFRLADAYTWEGGRGSRCEFWRAVSPRVPV